jgi:DNA-binding NtrC family response regulator
MSKSEMQILIIDDSLDDDDAIIAELSKKYESIVLRSTPEEGISYVEKNLDHDLIVILDIDFGGLKLNGHDVLNQIRKKSFLIPVIIWSSINEEKSTFSDLINNKAFAFVKRADTSTLFVEIEKAEAHIQNSLVGAIEDWISSHKEEDLEKPFLVLGNGKSLSLKQILIEIRMETELGRTIRKNLMKLTIDLLMRGKENLNG